MTFQSRAKKTQAVTNEFSLVFVRPKSAASMSPNNEQEPSSMNDRHFIMLKYYLTVDIFSLWKPQRID